MIQRTIDSIIAKYVLEPTVRDVYVEGLFDRNMVKWVLQKSKGENVQVLEIQTVEVPASALMAFGYTGGNKQRLLALAAILEQRLGTGSSQIHCVVDADCDRILNIPITGAFVLPTDYTCMEMYLFSRDELERFVVLVLERELNSAAIIIANYVSVLQELFLIRAGNQAMKLGLRWLDFTRCCAWDGGTVRFDRDEFVNRLLNECQARDRKADLLETIETLRLRLQADPRHHMHGHDFITLLAWHSRTAVPRNSLNEKAVLALLIHGVDFSRVRGEEMFRDLARKVL